MGNDILRGHVNMPNGEKQSIYFRNTAGNIASFIAKNEDRETRVMVENIFGRTIIKTVGVNGKFDGVQSAIERVGEELELIRKGVKKAELECFELVNLFGYEQVSEQF